MRILLIVHGYPPRASAGTEVYVEHLAEALARDSRDEVSVLTRDVDPSRPEYSVTRQSGRGVRVIRINNTFQTCQSFEDSYQNPALLRVAMKEIDAIDPSIVHVQHLTCLSTGLLESMVSRGYPVLMTLNDYWLICHRGQLFDRSGSRCEGPFEDGCENCVPPGFLARPAVFQAGRAARALRFLAARAAVRAGSALLEASIPVHRTRAATVSRLAHMREACRHVQLFLVPSETALREFQRFGIPRERLRRCTQGIDVARFQNVTRRPSSVLRLGFAGGLLPSKGAHVLLEAAGRMPRGSVVVDILGPAEPVHGDDSHARRLSPLLGLPCVRRVGPVPHDRMPEALSEIDVLVVPSLWIENAPFIIHEAFASGVPVVASNLGGMREMLVHGVNGLLFEPGSAEALTAAIARLAAEQDLLNQLREGLRLPPSVDDEAVGLRELYAVYAVRQPLADRFRALPHETTPTRRTVSALVLNYRTPDQTWLAIRSLQIANSPPDRIVVVDNASRDGSVQFLRQRIPGLEVLETERNLGFPAGCNAGIRRILEAGSDYVLLVNSDVVLRPDTIGALVDAAEQNSAAGILAPLILSREEPDRVASAGLDFSERTARMRHRAAGARVSSLPPPPVREVAAVSGCVMLIRSDVFARIGLLDEEYFFSFEDLDFCLRARRAGFGVLLVRDAIAYHEGGRSIGRRSPRRVYFATRNHLRLASAVIGGSPLVRLTRGGLIVGMNAAYAVLSRDVPLVRGLGAVARGARDHLLARYGLGS